MLPAKYCTYNTCPHISPHYSGMNQKLVAVVRTSGVAEGSRRLIETSHAGAVTAKDMSQLFASSCRVRSVELQFMHRTGDNIQVIDKELCDVTNVMRPATLFTCLRRVGWPGNVLIQSLDRINNLGGSGRHGGQ
mgnify:CR=1 FL=1